MVFKKNNRVLNLTGLSLGLAGLMVMSSCGDKRAATASTEITATAAVALIADGVDAAGAGLGGGVAAANFALSLNPSAVTDLTANMCGTHGQPLLVAGVEVDNSSYMPDSNAQYPYIHTYCALTVDDGDTVRGGFGLAKNLICSLEKGGIQFAGVAQTIAVDFTDTECWPDGGPDDALTSISITATGTSPAEFSTYFDKGVSFTVDFGDGNNLTFKLAANLDGDKIEFIASESWTDGSKGVMGGSIVKSTGLLQFEKRDERYDCATNGRCGWNRHTRLLANLTMSATGEPSGLESISYGYADSQENTYSKIVTADGSLDSEIKARLFTVSGTTAQIQDLANWSETANTACVSSFGIADAACATEVGIAMATADTKFALDSATAQLTPLEWITNFGGFNFTEVDLNVDQAFAAK